MVLKTRDKLIEVARWLFVHKGLDKTTMNDIAEASEKGRRTIYTYFKNKDEICDAIIEKESDNLLARLRDVVDCSLSPVEKLERYLRIRFEFLASLSSGKDYLKLLFSPEARRLRKVSRVSLARERDLFRQVVDEGIVSGDFDAEQARRLPAIEPFIVQAMNMLHAGDRAEWISEGVATVELKQSLIEFIIRGVAARPKADSPASQQSE